MVTCLNKIRTLRNRPKWIEVVESHSLEQDLRNKWGLIQYLALLFLAVALFSLSWVLFMGFLKINGIEVNQKEMFHFLIPFYGRIGIRWWQIEVIALGGWTLLFLLLVWIKLR